MVFYKACLDEPAEIQGTGAVPQSFCFRYLQGCDLTVHRWASATMGWTPIVHSSIMMRIIELPQTHGSFHLPGGILRTGLKIHSHPSPGFREEAKKPLASSLNLKCLQDTMWEPLGQVQCNWEQLANWRVPASPEKGGYFSVPAQCCQRAPGRFANRYFPPPGMMGTDWE